MPFQQRKAKSRLSKRHLSGTLMARPRYLGNVCLGKIKTDKMKALRNLVPFLPVSFPVLATIAEGTLFGVEN
jgi:hypothetical protein